MNDFETLEELRGLYEDAKQTAESSQERLDELTNLHYHRLVALDKVRERYLAHLEMMAAGVKQ